MKTILATTSAFALAIGLLASSPAPATPFTIYDVEVNKGESVTLSLPISDTYAFGQLVLTTSIGTIYAWCIDLFHTVNVGGGQNLPYTFAALSTDGRGDLLTATQTGEIAGLIVHGDALLAGDGGTNDDSLATQLAIWSVEYPGDFTYSAGASVTFETNSLIAMAPGLTGDGIALFSLDGEQGFAMATSEPIITQSDIPEPASLALFGAGLLGLGLGLTSHEHC